jgi:hypothetical protein
MHFQTRQGNDGLLLQLAAQLERASGGRFISNTPQVHVTRNAGRKCNPEFCLSPGSTCRPLLLLSSQTLVLGVAVFGILLGLGKQLSATSGEVRPSEA